MESVNWLAVILAASMAIAIGIVWHGPLFRTGKPLFTGGSQPTGNYLLVGMVTFAAAIMLGHMFARIGAETLLAKPWLYFMQSSGIAMAFVVPAVWLTHLRSGTAVKRRVADCGFWLVAYLAMGGVFWAFGTNSV